MKLTDLIKSKLSNRKCEVCNQRKAEVIKRGLSGQEVYVCSLCSKLTKW